MKTLEQLERYVELAYGDKPNSMDWREISEIENLPIEFISKYSERLDWKVLSYSQKLSEEMIELYSDKVSWHTISYYQKLSEKFMEKFWDKLDRYLIQETTTFSEEFIEQHAEKLNLTSLVCHQKLSEDFLEKLWDKLIPEEVVKCQYLSEEFRKKHELDIPKTTWLYKSTEFKKGMIQSMKKFKCFNDHFIAYINEKHYKHMEEISCFCDCTEGPGRSGFCFFNEKEIVESGDEDIVVGERTKVAIKYEDVGVIFWSSNGYKYRCKKMTILY